MMIFAVIGGDMRQLRLAEALCRDGHEVRSFAMGNLGALSPVTKTRTVGDAAAGADCVILPLPAQNPTGGLYAPLNGEKYSVEEVMTGLSPGQFIFAGIVNSAMEQAAAKLGLGIIDYYKREELIVMNAAATAEGAVQTAMEKTEKTLLGASCLVVGFGRIGKLLSHRLVGMGARVTASARSAKDLTWIKAFGFDSVDTRKLEGKMGGFDIIFNTVPVRIFDEKCVSGLKETCVYIEIASKPGGIDHEKAAEAGLKVIHATSLPGKTAPESSGEYIKDTIYNIISELEVKSFGETEDT